MALPGLTTTSPGFTLSIDNLEISDDHPDPPADAVTVTPNTLVANSTTTMVVQTEQPLFGDPTVEFSLGPGVLVDNFQILDDHTAVADVTTNSHIENQGHGMKVQTSTFIATGCFDVSGGTGDEDGNECPAVDYDTPVGLSAGEPFSVTVQVDDLDFDYPMVEVVVENPNLGFDEIIFQDTTQTSYEVPATLTFDFEGLPPGDYVILGIAADKVNPFSGNLVEKPFTVLDDDHTPAECNPQTPERNPAGQTFAMVEVEDRGYGLAEIRVVKAENVELQIPDFAPGELAPVYVIATRIDPTLQPYLELEVMDRANNVTRCEAFNFAVPDLGPRRSPKDP